MTTQDTSTGHNNRAIRIAVASGKGGTGKSLVASNLAYTLAQSRQVTLADCDVEEPNLHLFFPAESSAIEVKIPRPVFDFSLCDYCGRCGEFCRYGAIAVLKDRVAFFPELCHSCGGCTLVCPKGAIHEEPARIGQVTVSEPAYNLRLVTGILDEGKPLATPVIRAVKEMAANDPLVIYDSSPGTSCPVIETVEGSDFCLLVTESTPFGLHDLRLAFEVTRILDIPSGVVINRSDGKDDAIVSFCREHELPVLMTIPFDRSIAAIQNRGGLLCEKMPEWQERFFTLFSSCCEIIKVKG